MDKWYVYVLRSLKDNGIYVGMSRNPTERLKLHNQGKTHSTRNRKPFVLLHTEECSSSTEAKEKEKFYKSGFGRETLKEFFPGGSVGRAGGC